MKVTRVDKSNSNGTGLRGTFTSTYQNIVDKLGEPDGKSGDLKSIASWTVKVNEKFLSIYEYKSSVEYLGDKGKELKDIKEWNIGSNSFVWSDIKILMEFLEKK